jgi:hypothetical protein
MCAYEQSSIEQHVRVWTEFHRTTCARMNRFPFTHPRTACARMHRVPLTHPRTASLVCTEFRLHNTKHSVHVYTFFHCANSVRCAQLRGSRTAFGQVSSASKVPGWLLDDSSSSQGCDRDIFSLEPSPVPALKPKEPLIRYVTGTPKLNSPQSIADHSFNYRFYSNIFCSFYDTLSSLDQAYIYMYIASNIMLVNFELKNVEGRSRGLFLDTVPSITWNDWGK